MSCKLVLLAFGLAGCAAAPPPPSPYDPSNPDAAESPFAHTATVPPPDSDAGPPRFVCPMHADVVRDVPGQCPKCHMTLVPLGAP